MSDRPIPEIPAFTCFIPKSDFALLFFRIDQRINDSFQTNLTCLDIKFADVQESSPYPYFLSKDPIPKSDFVFLLILIDQRINDSFQTNLTCLDVKFADVQ